MRRGTPSIAVRGAAAAALLWGLWALGRPVVLAAQGTGGGGTTPPVLPAAPPAPEMHPAGRSVAVTTSADTSQSIAAPSAGGQAPVSGLLTAPASPHAAPSTGVVAAGAAGTGGVAPASAGSATAPGAVNQPLTSRVLAAVNPVPHLDAGGGLSATATIPLERVVAVVGDEPILWSSILERINVQRAQGMQVPPDSAGQMGLARAVTDQLVDEQLLVAKAQELKIEVTDEDVAAGVDGQIKRIRSQFPTNAVYRVELRKAGLGSPEEYRRTQMDEAKRAELQRKVIDHLKKDGKLVPVGVSDQDVADAFERAKTSFPRRPATVTFRQIVVAPKPSPAAKAAAKVRADSLLVELKKVGADADIDKFAMIARRESMDPGTREVGGDLGWNRRGIMVPEFDASMFGLRPGTLSPVIETAFGFHIIRVDRVKPGEVKASHILIRWKADSTQVVAAKVEADSVLAAWEAGANIDTLTIKHHDPREEKGALQPFPRDSLPPSYAAAFSGRRANAFVGPFPIEDKANATTKYVVAQLLSYNEGGEYTLVDVRGMLRDQLSQERSIRRLLDGLRKETYVSIRL